MIHLYCGDGKGKTTAAMGLVLRAAGRGMGVVVAQFLKGAQLPQITLLEVPPQVKFTFAMTPEELEVERLRSQALLRRAGELARTEGCGLLVLDEVCGAVSAGVLPLPPVLDLLDQIKAEIVLTGRDPAPALTARADYITRFVSLRHPYDGGQSARCGIEFEVYFFLLSHFLYFRLSLCCF